MKKLFIVLLIVFCSLITAKAQFLRGGEITSSWVSGLTYSFRVVLYTFDTLGIDSPTIQVGFGDGTYGTITRTMVTLVGNNISLNIYSGPTAIHTYSGQGSYIISVADSFRVAGVMNIPNSVNTPLCIEELLTINPFIGVDNSPVFANSQLDISMNNGTVIHDPGISDIESDSLVYSLVPAGCALGFTYPSASDTIGINPLTGVLSWDKPISTGLFNVCIKVSEYRNSILIGTVTRDMLIKIDSATKVFENNVTNSISIYPNPSSNNLYIEIPQKAEIEILNVQGQIIKIINTAEKQTTIDVSNLSSGVYIIKAKTEKGVAVKKFMKE